MTVISIINLKGGVGKTQTTVALSEFLSYNYKKRVLVIDLDPQTNATVSLMDEMKWYEKDRRGETLFQLFNDKIYGMDTFNGERAVVKSVSNINGGIENLDLIPSSLRLIDLEDKLPLISNTGYYVKSPVTVLADSLSGIIKKYDFVIIDCPPNLGLITLSGIYISDYYIIPTIPDILSTYGIPQIISRIESFKKDAGIKINPLGILISMYRSGSRLHRNVIESLQSKAEKGEYPKLFKSYIPLSAKITEAADFNSGFNTIKQKYEGEIFNRYDELARELLEYVR
ncbi:ParA family protein [Picrophilus oshimae]|uniref:Chromosome partitioning protein n=1 Tax=Picrophilus torridus (strain ATCC 700027 / DSM 9790 / JCM 10055 / NBRC 100828 / KAW 2/3) TaxID=1122961 RepID=Q6L011_PICTO|nr:AAA family ATPase [Picrophilus oshimae]AAT43691.1 hypothetical regulatory protein [Picrophilus oshimae DSM 9789]SMD31315.1 chromosome partitioning protein [Picrophilus oshimae DSM 9789]